MEENKKRPLSEEELEQVAGGTPYQGHSDGKSGWKCGYCSKSFSTFEEAEEHEATCPVRVKGSNPSSDDGCGGGGGYQRLLKPIIL